MSGVEKRLEELGIKLPSAPASAANYVPYVIMGDLVFVSGQLPIASGDVTCRGHLGGGVSIDDGYQAAKVCAINVIAQLSQALDGDLDRVQRVIRLGGFVSSSPNFTDHPKVVNGASDLMVEVFGENGRHARAAVGVSSLPLGSAVEVEALVKFA